MVVKTTGLILKHRNLGESDRAFVILSGDFGIIEAVAHNINRLKNNPSATIFQFGYYEFELFTGKERYYIKSSRLIEGFTGLTVDLPAVSLAGYFSELAAALSVSDHDAKEFLRLFLNALYYLNTAKKPPAMLKAVFELRALSLGGFQPDLVGCTECHTYENPEFHFYPFDGVLYCPNCDSKDKSGGIRITMPLLAAMRHIVYSEFDKIFSLSMTDYNALCAITQQYALIHTAREYNSLNMYNQFKGTDIQ